MELTKSIIFFDLETTGVDVNKDRIVEISATKKNPDGTQETKTILVNPTVPIPKEASDVHGITDEVVADAPTFAQISKSLRAWFDGCDLGGFNSDSFDVSLLNNELERAGLEGVTWNPSLVDVMKLYRKLHPNTLSDVYKRLIGKDLDNAHSAEADILATMEVLDCLYESMEEKPQSPQEMDLFLQGDKFRVDIAGKLYKDADGVVRYNFGKEKDKSIKEAPGFKKWMLDQSFIPKETKTILRSL